MNKSKFNDTLSDSEEEINLFEKNSDEHKPKTITSSDYILIRLI
jgi:hypothetical protein